MSHHPFARLALLTIAAVLTLAPLAKAESAADAQSFIQTSIDQGVAVMGNKTLDAATRRTQIKALLERLMDTKRIGLFSLGADKEKASPGELNDYTAAFHDFMISSYVNRLSDYDGQAIRVTGVMAHAPGDYIVEAQFVDPSDPSPVKIDIRVLAENGTYGVVDASVAGIWFMQAQKADFVGYLSQHGDSVAQLTQHLKELTASGFKAQ